MTQFPSNIATPSPEWCVRDAYRNPAYMGPLIEMANGTRKERIFSARGGEGWDGVSFWRSAEIREGRLWIEFNENYAERFSNPEWVWHPVPGYPKGG